MIPWLALALGLAAEPPRVAGPQIVRVGVVDRDLLEVEIQIGYVEHATQVPYEPQPGDQIEAAGQQAWVKRGGRVIGGVVGPDRRLLCGFDRLVAEPLPDGVLDQAASYRVTSADDPAFATAAAPVLVARKSKPTDLARTDAWRFSAPVRHHVFLHLPRPLTGGATYRVELAAGPGQAATLRWDWRAVRSSAVHVSQLGFRPDDPVKVGFLSLWKGSGGAHDYGAPRRFEVVDDATGTVVQRGSATVAKRRDDATEDAYRKNHNGTDVWLLDFSDVRRPGTYRVAVDGVGCSYPFRIDPDVWRQAFTVAARGFYHQRSGVELGPPYTTFRRPRCFHPDDGVVVRASTCPLLDSGNGLNRQDSNFGNLVKGATDQPVADAWGGLQDAGDWDRRIQHLAVSRLLLELAEAAPDYFAALSLNLPESGGELPDIVDEALFNLDGYRRMQTPEGGIRGGIESAEHPRHGEASWQESLPVYAYAPDVWSSYVYAGVAARAAGWLAAHRPRVANPYRESARRAMVWAEAELPRRDAAKDPPEVRDSRNLAALELYLLTGDERWRTVFESTTLFTKPGVTLWEWQHHDQRDAAWRIASAARPLDPRVGANARAALLAEANDRVVRGRQTGFRWTGHPWAPLAYGALTTPDAVTLVRAHRLTGDETYLVAALLACQFGAGANPSNLCYTTGLGHDWPRHPLHVDSRVSGQEAPAGLTIFGPSDPARDAGQWAQRNVAPFIFPDVGTWPATEAFWDVFWYPSQCEYTVTGPMAPNAYVWGYLAARP